MIVSARYNEKGAIIVTVDGAEMYVPDDCANRDRKALVEWEAQGNLIAEFEPLPLPPPVVEVASALLWERLTEAEAEQVEDAMATQPFRTRQIFMTANTFRSDHELWPLLVQMATGLFGEERAAELLDLPSIL